jgi:hypothetical protein
MFNSSDRFNRKRALAVLVAALTVVSIAFGAGSLLAASPAKQAVTRINLVEREVTVNFVDQGKDGPGLGDRMTIKSDILDLKGRRVGRGDFSCNATGEGEHGGGICQGVVTLPGGQLTGQWAFGRSGSTRLQAIVGGTGKYEGVRGQFIVTTTNGAVEPFVIELVR